MKRTTTISALAGLVVSSALTLLPAHPAGATAPPALTGRASVLPGATEPTAKGDSTDGLVSGNGRFVVFTSASRLVGADTDSRRNVYLKDLLTDQVERIDVTVDGSAASNDSAAGAISSNGYYVVFWSWADNLVPGDTNNKADVFIRDRAKGTTERVSVTSGELQANGASPSIINGDRFDVSDDGRLVAFTSSATNLAGDANTLSDVFVRDRQAGTTELISTSSAEVPGTSNSYAPSMSADGRYVAFESDAPNLVAPDNNSGRDIYVRDRQNGNTTRVSLHDGDFQPASGQSYSASIDDGGSYVAFASTAKLVAADTNTSSDVYVRNRSTNTTTLASATTGNVAAGSSSLPRISGNGAAVAFTSTATNLIAGGSNGWDHIYVRQGGTTTLATRSSLGTMATGASTNASLSTDGKVMAFDSASPNLVTGDAGFRDVFFRRVPNLGPFTSVSDFATSQLQRFTGTVPGGPALAATTAMLAGASPEHWTVGLANDPTFAGKRPPLVRLYTAYFNRLPDLGGLTYWTGKLASGTKLDKVSASFAASSEFKAKYGDLTNAEFVTRIYDNIFDRSPDPSGLAYWTKKLDGGMSRGTVMTNFSESSEGKRVLAPYVQTTLISLGMLHKMPSSTLTGSLVTTISVAGPEGGVQVMLASPDYQTLIV